MLIEVFTDRVCEIHNDGSKSPAVMISDPGGLITGMHVAASKYIKMALDNEVYNLFKGGRYMLEVELKGKTDYTTITYANTSMSTVPQATFGFKFNSLNSGLSDEYRMTIHGDIVLDKDCRLIAFKRDDTQKITTATISTVKVSNDTAAEKAVSSMIATTTTQSGYRAEVVDPFDSSCQQSVPTDEDSEDAGSNNTSDPVELSENSFTVSGSIISISSPELKIGTVDNDSFNIDAEKQRKQDEFLRNMSIKMSKRHKK